MRAHPAVQVFGVFTLILQVGHRHADIVHRIGHYCLLLAVVQPGKDGVEVHLAARCFLECFQRVVLSEFGVAVGVALGIVVVGMTHTVVEFPDRVHVVQDLT